MNILKRIYVSVAVGLCCAIVIGMVQFDKRCDALRDNCLRMHVLANSNSNFDQQLKLKVRDEVLTLSQDIFADAETLEQAIAAAEDNSELIAQKATQVCAQNGTDYTVKCEIDTEYFTTRHYENFTLPAGNYKAVRLLIGEAKGKNWWCVMFPSVCIGAAGEQQLASVAGEDAARVATSGTKYKMKFKVVELYQNVKQWFSSQK